MALAEMPPNGLERSTNTLLLDIIERLAIVEQQIIQVLHSQTDADDSRKAIHARLNTLSGFADTVKRLEPVVMELEQMRQRAIGVQFIGRVFWVLAGTILTALGAVIERIWGH
jgi:hypothetical protein